MTAINRQKVIERAISELRRAKNIIVDGRNYYWWGWGMNCREYTPEQKLDICKQKIEMIIKEFEKL